MNTNISYSYQNVDGKVAFSGTINGKKYTDYKEFMSAVFDPRLQVPDTVDTLKTYPDNSSIVLVDCPEVTGELQQIDLIKFCEKLKNAYESILEDGISKKNSEICADNYVAVAASLKDITTLIDKNIEEANTIRNYLKMSDELAEALRNIPDKQKMQLDISDTIKERLARIQSTMAVNKRWQYLYERARLYFAYAAKNNMGNELRDFNVVLKPFLAKNAPKTVPVNEKPDKPKEQPEAKKENTIDSLFEKLFGR